jgi:hypothetical protein
LLDDRPGDEGKKTPWCEASVGLVYIIEMEEKKADV